MKAKYSHLVQARQLGRHKFLVECRYLRAAVRFFVVITLAGRTQVTERVFVREERGKGFAVGWDALSPEARATIRGLMPTDWWDEFCSVYSSAHQEAAERVQGQSVDA